MRQEWEWDRNGTGMGIRRVDWGMGMRLGD